LDRHVEADHGFAVSVAEAVGFSVDVVVWVFFGNGAGDGGAASSVAVGVRGVVAVMEGPG
jgi:hypothetical protein